MSFSKWCAMLPTFVLRTRTAFAQFLKATFHLQRDGSVTATTLFPIPVPTFEDGKSLWGRMSPNISKAVRDKIHRARMLHVFVVALNYWYYQGFYCDVSLMGRLPSSTHRRIFAKLRATLRSEWSTETFEVSRAGRRFPQLGARLSELSQFVTAKGLSGAPYSRAFQGCEVPTDDTVMPELEPYRDLDPSRIVLHGTGAWDATEWLHDALVMGYREPATLLVDRIPEPWEFPTIREHADTITALAKVWDEQGLLYLHHQELPRFQKVRIFNCFKSATVDRQIGDRRGRNAIEAKMEGPSFALPAGEDLLSIHLDPLQQTLRISISDRRDFYHQFFATESRCISNTIAPEVPLSTLSSTKAYSIYLDGMLKKKRYRRRDQGDMLHGSVKEPPKLHENVSCSFKAVLQGDQAGVEIATDAHSSFLECHGCLSESSRVTARKPPLAQDCFEGLVIDDYFAISIESPEVASHRSRSALLHSKALAVYETYNILGSPAKDIIGADKGKIIGAQLDSTPATRARGQCLLSAPSNKRLALAWVSIHVAMLTHTTDSLHVCLLGGWTSAMLFRRPFMSLIKGGYSLVAADSVDAQHPKLISLPRAICDELVMLAVMAPLMSSNLGAGLLSKIFATDASMEKGAVLEAEMQYDIAMTMHKALRSKGAYTRLSQVGDLIGEDLEHNDPVLEVERPLAHHYDFLELFAGAARISHFMSLKGWVVGPPLDISFSPEYDIKLEHVARWITFLISTKRVKSFACEPPCTTYSIMRRPALRDKDHVYGFNPHDPQTQDGNVLGQRAFQILHCGVRYTTPGILETPHSSKLKRMPSWVALQEEACTSVCRTDSCRFGSQHRKSFSFMGAYVDLTPLRKTCKCLTKHVQIQGAYTKLSATYVDPLAECLAEVLSQAILAMKTLDEEYEDLEVAGLENQLVNSVVKSAPWKLRKVWSFPRQVHINILEMKVVQQLCLQLGFETASKKITILVDSNVIRCAVSKGRSASLALTNVLVKLDAICIACDFILVVCFCPTRLNVADDPTRDQPLRSPTQGVCQGAWKPEDLFKLATLPRLKRWASNWVCLVVLLIGPDILGLTDRSRFRSFGARSVFQTKYAQASMDFDTTPGLMGEGYHSSSKVPKTCPPSCLDFDQTLGFPVKATSSIGFSASS